MRRYSPRDHPPVRERLSNNRTTTTVHSDRILHNLSLNAVELGVEVELVDDVTSRVGEPGGSPGRTRIACTPPATVGHRPDKRIG